MWLLLLNDFRRIKHKEIWEAALKWAARQSNRQRICDIDEEPSVKRSRLNHNRSNSKDKKVFLGLLNATTHTFDSVPVWWTPNISVNGLSWSAFWVKIKWLQWKMLKILLIRLANNVQALSNIHGQEPSKSKLSNSTRSHTWFILKCLIATNQNVLNICTPTDRQHQLCIL